jgi:hypothetical protein
MSIEQSTTIPAPLKSLTGKDGNTYIIAPGIILQARALTSGSEVTWQDSALHKVVVPVTDTIASIIAGTDLFAVTLYDGDKVVYIPASRVHSVGTHLQGRCRITTLSDTSMVEGCNFIDVTQTVAQVKALILAAGTGGTGQQLTTGSTATVVTQSSVNVVTVTSAGQVVQLSDSFPETIIVDASANYMLLTPPTGSQIDTCATNEGVRVLGYSVVLFKRISATSWVSAVLKQSAHTYASSITSTATVVTAQVASLTTSATSVTNFYEYGDALTGEIPAKMRATNTSPATTAIMKFAGGFTDTTGALGGVSIATQYEIPPGVTVEFTYNRVTGKVVVSGNNVLRGTATLVLGAKTFNSAAIGAQNSARISANTRIVVTGISAVNGGTLATRFIPTIVAGTSIAIQGYDATGALLNTDVSTIIYEIHF